MADINMENLNNDRIKLVDEIKQKQEQTMADCFNLTNAAELVEQLRSNPNNVWMTEAADAIEADRMEIAGLRMRRDELYGKIEQLELDNAKLKAERDAAVAAVEELNDDFVECVCSGYGNLSPYCGNRCAECVDKRGWCKEVTKYCRGFIPMSYKDWRGAQKEEE